VGLREDSSLIPAFYISIIYYWLDLVATNLTKNPHSKREAITRKSPTNKTGKSNYKFSGSCS
jgi:hypothetical protein